MTAPAPAPTQPGTTDNDEGMWHIVCPCDLTVSLCGMTEPGSDPETYLEDDEIECVVCRDLAGYECERCGT